MEDAPADPSSVPHTRWVIRITASAPTARAPGDVAQLLDRVDVGRHRIDADHKLDAVVAQPAGQLERTRGRLWVDRGGGQTDLGGGDLNQSPVGIGLHTGKGRHLGSDCARSVDRISPSVRGVRRPGRSGPGLSLRPDLAHFALDVHLRPRLSRCLRGPPRRRLLHPVPIADRDDERRVGGAVRQLTSAQWQHRSRPAGGWVELETRTTSRGRPARGKPGSWTEPAFPERPGCPAARVVPASPRAGPGPGPDRDQARCLLAAADPAAVPHRDRTTDQLNEVASASTGGRLGSGWRDLDWYCTANTRGPQE